MQLQSALLVDGVRSPFARGGRGKLVATRLDDAGAQLVRALLARNPKVSPRSIEDVGLGNVRGEGEFVGLGADLLRAVPRLHSSRSRSRSSTPRGTGSRARRARPSGSTATSACAPTPRRPGSPLSRP